MRFDRNTVISVSSTIAGLVIGLIAWVAGRNEVADIAWSVTGAIAAIPLMIGIVGSIRRREWGLDVIALLAVGGSIILGEYLAAAIVGVMLATGEALDAYAAARAKRELTSLLERAPREAHVVRGDSVDTVAVDAVAIGDRLVVRTGEIVPVDGMITEGTAVLDESSLTGEASPVSHPPGDHVASGTTNGGDAFHMVATSRAADSTYAGIVRLVRQAQESKAPVSRLADRYAIGFVPLALAVAAIAWIVSGDPVRGLAVLVVATPCPLLLAIPIAIVSGISRAANRGVVVKGGGVLEQLADADTLIIDKTGTLTMGEATLTGITSFGPGEDELLRLGASLDQLSNHVLATALVAAARRRGLALEFPTEVSETLGSGIRGLVGGRRVAVGRAEWVVGGQLSPEVIAYRRRSARVAAINIFVAIDGAVAGVFRLTDEVRPDTPRTIRLLRRHGIRTVIMATGDHPVVAEAVGSAIGVDRVLSQCTPEEKVTAVRTAASSGTTVMVGDGINDAPALAAADVGVAMGARGATSSSEAADVVLVVDRLDRLADALGLARRSRSIARQSAFLGMGLSLGAMGAASFGYLPPVAGALVQEAIDVLAILSALRALRDGRAWRTPPSLPADLSARLRAEHELLMPKLDQIGVLADRLDALAPENAISEIRRIDRLLQEEILPHERSDDREIYPVLSKLLGGDDPMAAMSLTHGEIFKLAGQYHRLVDDLDAEQFADVDVYDVRRLLFGLDTILKLHFAQEEELYQSLDEVYRERSLEPAQLG